MRTATFQALLVILEGGFNRDMKEDGGNKQSQEYPDHLPGFLGGMGASICQHKSGC
jgi:hypothetical protein